MFIKKNRPWQIPEKDATPEDVFMNRREFLRSMGAYGIGAGALLAGYPALFDIFGRPKRKEELLELTRTGTTGLYPARKNTAFKLDRPVTDEVIAASYNNFYEFSPAKSNVWKLARNMQTRPWTVEVAGLVERPRVYDIDELVRKMPLEERLYRFRCVEAWAMAVPWTGFPMRAFLKEVKPLSSARYVRFQTFFKKSWAIQQELRFWLPWPYEEGLTMEEASNELTMLVTGIYGHELPRQHGAPMRLIVPWKYGFKSIKSIVRIEFARDEPHTFWNTLVPDEYDFRANVNPDVPHPRWSQATERMIDTDELRPTVKYNGYGELVASIYEK